MTPKKIWMVFKTHFDIGYTHLAGELIPYYSQKLLPQAIDTCNAMREKMPDMPYVWTMPSWPLKTVLESPVTSEDVRDQVEMLLESGELAFHALPFTTHTEFCGVEEYIRGMMIAREMADKYGREVISAKMTDVPGHTRFLPSLLAKAGVKFLHLGCNAGSMPPDVPRLFHWQGPDGGRVLTFYNKGGYGSTLAPPDDWRFPVWLAFMHANDNANPQTPDALAAMLDEASRQLPGTEIRIGTMDDFYRDLAAYDLSDVPVVTDDLADTWIHGVGTYPEEVSLLRHCRNMLTETEKVVTLCGHATEGSKKTIGEAYEKCLLFGEHTWGLDVKTTMGCNRHYHKQDFIEHRGDPLYRRMEASWEEQRLRATESAESVANLNKGTMDSLAAAVAAEGERIVVFNGLGFERDGWVDLTDHEPAIKGRAITLNGLALRTRKRQGKLEAFIGGLPRLGYVTLALSDAAIPAATKTEARFDEANGVLENRRFCLRLSDNRTSFVSLIDRKTGKEWLDAGESMGLGLYQYDVFGLDDITEFIRAYSYRFYDWLVNDLGRLSYPDCRHLTFLPLRADASFEEGDGFGTLTLTVQNPAESAAAYGSAEKAILRVTLYDDCDLVDVSLSLPNKQASPYVESGSLVFPFAGESASVRVNKMGHMVDIDRDISRSANHEMYCMENFVSVERDGRRVALIAKDSPLISVGENGVYRYRRERKPGKPTVYANLFNNSWGTNFPQWMSGDYEYGFRMVFDRTDGEVFRLSQDFMSPPLIGYATGPAGSLPTAKEFIQRLDGFRLLAVKESRAGNSLVLRVQDITGMRRETEITFTASYKAIKSCGILEQEKRELTQNGDTVRFATEPFEIHTFCLEN